MRQGCLSCNINYCLISFYTWTKRNLVLVKLRIDKKAKWIFTRAKHWFMCNFDSSNSAAVPYCSPSMCEWGLCQWRPKGEMWKHLAAKVLTEKFREETPVIWHMSEKRPEELQRGTMKHEHACENLNLFAHAAMETWSYSSDTKTTPKVFGS